MPSTSINKKRLSLMAAAALTAMYAAFAGGGQSDDITLEATSAWPVYAAAGDTVAVGVKASIPQGYHLYSNPLGPGIGKPLNLFVSRRDTGAGRRAPWRVDWVEAKKSIPKRYNPPIGSWVWAYESEAYFFVKGVLERDTAAADTAAEAAGANAAKAPVNAKGKQPAPAKDKDAGKGKLFGGLKGKKGAPEAAKPEPPPPPPQRLAYEITVEALMCKSACIPILQSIRFDVPLPPDALGDRVVERGRNDPAPNRVVERSRNAAAPSRVVERSRNDPASDMAAERSRNEPGPAFAAAPVLRAHYAKSETVAFSVGAPSAASAAQIGVGADLSGLSGLSGLPPAPLGGGVDADASQTDQQGDSDYGADPADAAPGGRYDYSPLEERREYSLLTAVLFALLAGLALNLTPCIFPMLSVRVLSFAESAQESRRSAVVRSAVFSLGIVAVFLLLAGLAAFAGFSWGQQFQNPGMMVGIIAVVFLFALGMFNFYTLSVPAIGSGGGGGGGPTFAGDFLKGAAATVMATPCGGPFLGALLAWALLQKPLIIFALFAAMGVGMGLPYVLLASSKRLMSLLPKPGRWIEDLKHFMGFLLLAFAVNMMRSLDPRLTTTAVGVCLSILVAASVNKRFTRFGMPAARRAVAALASLALLTAGIIVSVAYLRIDVQIFNDDQPGVGGPYWTSFSARALESAHEEGRNVIVNFTASWCTNCKLNKAAALNTSAARQLYKEKNILLLTADITNDNPEAQELMRHLGSRSVPFLAIFPGDAPRNPVIMRDILSKEKFLGEMRNLP